MINWHPLNNEEQLLDLIAASEQEACLIFKHSTSCSISALAKARLERSWDFAPAQIMPYYLDLLSFRALSNQVAAQFGVSHESPQVLLIRNGHCVYDESHLGISVEGLAQALAE